MFHEYNTGVSHSLSVILSPVLRQFSSHLERNTAVPLNLKLLHSLLCLSQLQTKGSKCTCSERTETRSINSLHTCQKRGEKKNQTVLNSLWKGERPQSIIQFPILLIGMEKKVVLIQILVLIHHLLCFITVHSAQTLQMAMNSLPTAGIHHKSVLHMERLHEEL